MRSCQDVSAAGRRAGLADGTRTGLWARFADAIAAIRPRYVVAENVRGLLNAAAHRPMESEPNALGDGNSEPVLRAIGAVLGDLADLGYDAQWVTVSAASIGAPHRRERVFILATDTDSGQRCRRADESEQSTRSSARVPSHVPRDGRSGVVADTDGGSTRRRGQSGSATPHRDWQAGGAFRCSQAATDTCGGGCEECPQRNSQPVGPELEASQRRNPDGRSDVAAHSPRDGRNEGWPKPTRLVGGSDAAVSGDGPIDLLPTPRSSRGASTTETAYALGGVRDDSDRPQGRVLLPTPNASDGTGGGQHPSKQVGHSRQLIDYALLLATPSTADGGGGHINRSGDRKGELLLPGQAREMATSWGKYAPAIARWESLTRPAPAPTEPNTKGNPRLNAAFSEWLMGWPAGHVTDISGISRNDALRIVGNGVCPQQATAALRWLLNVAEVAA